MSDVLYTIVQVGALVFVVSSMLAMGLSLTLDQIVEPLRNARTVVIALAINFVLAPVTVWLIQLVLDLDDDLYTGLILLAVAAGAPFLPKLAQTAHGDAAFSVGLMVLLMVSTVIVMPIALPLILSGASVEPWDIASSLIFLMLLPLAIGLVVRARYRATASALQPHMAQASTLALLILLVGGIVLQWDGIVSLVGTGGIVAMVVFTGVLVAVGYVSGGSGGRARVVMGLGTAQRNVAAALVVAAQNFSDRPNVITMVMVGALVGLVILLPLAGEFGRRLSNEHAEASG